MTTGILIVDGSCGQSPGAGGQAQRTGLQEADDFFVTNLTVSSHGLLKKREASASVYNLFDRKYSDPGPAELVQDLLKQDGRSFRLKLTYHF